MTSSAVATTTSSRWHMSAFDQNVHGRRAAGALSRWGLMTDVDNTMLLGRASDSVREAGILDAWRVARLSKRYGVPLIAVTGRDIPMMERDYEAGLLPMFDAALVSLGSELFINRDGRYVADESWQRFIEDERGFDRSGINAVCRTFLRSTLNKAAANPDIFGESFIMEFQPRDEPANVAFYDVHSATNNADAPHHQPPQPYKISFIYYGTLALAKLLKSGLRSMLEAARFPDARVQMSIDSHTDGDIYRQNIDVLPILKDEAAAVLAADLDATYGKRFWAFAGDSQNDYPALMHFGDAGIVVGGSDDGLNQALAKLPTRHAGPRITRTDDGRVLYRRTATGPIGPGSILEAARFYERLAALTHPQ